MRCFIGSPVNINDVYNSINYNDKKIQEALLHITYYFLGEIDNSFSNEICSKFTSLKIKKFNVSINGIHGFPDDKHARILYLKIGPGYINHIYDEIVSTINLPPHSFNPHITIYRFKKFTKIIENNIKFNITINKICLYESIFNDKRIYNELCCDVLQN